MQKGGRDYVDQSYRPRSCSQGRSACRSRHCHCCCNLIRPDTNTHDDNTVRHQSNLSRDGHKWSILPFCYHSMCPNCDNEKQLHFWIMMHTFVKGVLHKSWIDCLTVTLEWGHKSKCVLVYILPYSFTDRIWRILKEQQCPEPCHVDIYSASLSLSVPPSFGWAQLSMLVGWTEWSVITMPTQTGWLNLNLARMSCWSVNRWACKPLLINDRRATCVSAVLTSWYIGLRLTVVLVTRSDLRQIIKWSI